MDRPPPDLAKLLESWMAWERGTNPPGRTLADLKIAGLREVLEGLVAALPTAAAVDSVDDVDSESWTPVV